jgi:predicted peroxiredoxin
MERKSEMTEKMAVVCNGNTPANIMPTLIFTSSGLSLDYEVHVFFCPAGANWLLKGELEKLGSPKGLPNPIELFNTILDLGGEIVLCELALENKDIDPKDLRDERIKIKKAPPYLMDIEGAKMTFTF